MNRQLRAIHSSPDSPESSGTGWDRLGTASPTSSLSLACPQGSEVSWEGSEVSWEGGTARPAPVGTVIPGWRCCRQSWLLLGLSKCCCWIYFPSTPRNSHSLTSLHCCFLQKPRLE